MTAALFALAQAWSQDPKQALQQRLAEIKQSMAQNQAQLRQYSWTETTEISLKGEAKKREQNECRYGPDGKVVKTPIGEPAEPKKAPRGLKGRVVKNKIEDMKEYMDRVGSLVRRYIPPDPQAMQAAFQAGKASLTPGPVASLVFSDYAKPGDKVTLAFDTAAKKLKSFQVATYLDEPADTVSLVANFSSLADGTSYLEQSVLDAKAKEIQIKTANFGHKKAN
jgi:hypothetical protein